MRINGGERHSDRHMQKPSCKCNMYQKSATQATERHRHTHAGNYHANTMCIKSLRHKKRSATDIHTHAENIMQMQCVSKVCDASKGAPQTDTCRAENIMQMQCVSKVCDASDGAPQTDTCGKHHANAMCIKSLRHQQRCATDRHIQKAS